MKRYSDVSSASHCLIESADVMQEGKYSSPVRVLSVDHHGLDRDCFTAPGDNVTTTLCVVLSSVCCHCQSRYIMEHVKFFGSFDVNTKIGFCDPCQTFLRRRRSS